MNSKRPATLTLPHLAFVHSLTQKSCARHDYHPSLPSFENYCTLKTSIPDVDCDRAGGGLAGVQQVPRSLLLHRLPLLPLPHAGVPRARGGRPEEVLLLRNAQTKHILPHGFY